MATIVKRASDVRIQEINMSQIIASEATSVAASPIVSKKGPLGPQHFTNPTDFIANYGDADPSVSNSIQIAKDYFTEGNDFWGLRVVGDGSLFSALLMYQDGDETHLLPISGGVEDPTNPDWAALVPHPNNEAIALFYPSCGPGSYGDNFGISLATTNILSPASLTLDSSSTGGSLTASTYEYRISSIGPNGETLVSAPAQIVISNAGVTNSVEMSWPFVQGAQGYKIYGRNPGDGLLAVIGAGTTTFRDTGALTPDNSQQPIDNPSDLPEDSNLFTVRVFDLDANGSVAVEEFDCTLGYNVGDDGMQTELEERINPFSQYMRVTSNAVVLDPDPTITAAPMTKLAGGDSGSAPTSYQIALALEAFLDKERYPINMLLDGGFTDPIVQKKVDQIVTLRQDAIGILAVPSTKQKFQDAINYRNLELNLNSTYSALFCPDILEADLVNGRQIYIPFTGMAAALVARTDKVANPAFSIAGLNRGQVGIALKQRYTYDDGQAGNLFRAQVNYLRTFTGQGIALWEQQTLSAEFSALSWLSVRRIVNVIKTSVYKFLLYALQEPNDDFLGRQIVDGVTSYLQAIKDSRGISSFTVVSDSSNNKPATLNAGIRIVSIVIVPMIPTHEIQVQMIVSKQGVEFEEVLRQVNGE